MVLPEHLIELAWTHPFGQGSREELGQRVPFQGPRSIATGAIASRSMTTPTERQGGARLLGYLRAQWRDYAVGITALLFTNICAAGLPYLTKRVFDVLQGVEEVGAVGGERAAVGRYVLMMVGVATLMAVIRVVSRVFIFNGGRMVEYEVRNELYGHLQRLSPSFFGRMPVGDLVSRVTNDITALRLLGGPGVLNIANTAIVYVTAVTPMVLISPMLTAWALAPLVLVFFSTRVVGRRIYARSYEAQERLSTLSGLANESITGIEVLQAYTREAARQEAFADASDGYRKAYLRWLLLRSVLLPILAGMGGMGTLAILYFGGRGVIDGTLTLGDFVAVMGYLAMLMWPTVALGWMVSLWQRGRAAADRLAEILDTPPEVSTTADATEQPRPQGWLEVRGLSFAWPGAPAESRDVLHDISFSIEPGEHVLVVGPSGAGKSTLVSLLPRLSEVPEGTVLLDGTDVRRFPLEQLRRHIAFVPQEPFLFSMSVAENIGFGLDQPTDDAVRDAAGLAALTSDIARFPARWDTVVGERGVTLSGGQRQRMTIARAAVLRPSLWVFDDCLSSVDAATEQEIIRSLRSMTDSATALFVTHRLLGFEGVDRVLVMRDGRITEQGTHAELMDAGGWYAALYRRQRLDRDLADAPGEVA